MKPPQRRQGNSYDTTNLTLASYNQSILHNDSMLENSSPLNHFDSCHDLIEYQQFQLQSEIDKYFEATQAKRKFHIPEPWKNRKSGYETFQKANVISPLHFEHQKGFQQPHPDGLERVTAENLEKRHQQDQRKVNQTRIRKASPGFQTKSGSHGLFKRFNYPGKTTSPGPGSYSVYPRIQTSNHSPPNRKDRSDERLITHDSSVKRHHTLGAAVTQYNPNYSNFLAGHQKQKNSFEFMRESKDKRSVSNQYKHAYSPGPGQYFQDTLPIMEGKPPVISRQSERPFTRNVKYKLGVSGLDLNSKNKNSRGGLFSRQRRANPGESSTSPYQSRARKQNPFSRNKSITRMESTPDPNVSMNAKNAMLLAESQSGDGFASLYSKTKFQKFSEVERFSSDPRIGTPNVSASRDSTEMKRTLRYRPLLNKPEQTMKNKDFVLENLHDVKHMNPKGLFIRRKFSALKRDKIFEKVQEKRERVLYLKQTKATNNWEYKQIKSNSMVQPSQAVNLVQNWSMAVSIEALLTLVAKHYKRRKLVRDRIARWMSILYNVSKALGKFKRRVYHAKRSRSLFKIVVFISVYGKRWLKSRRDRHAIRIVKFCKQQQSTPYFVHMMNQFLTKIKFIQRWLRKISVRLSIRTALMNYQWSNIQSEITSTRSKSKLSSQSSLLVTERSKTGEFSPNLTRDASHCELPDRAVSLSGLTKGMSSIIPLRVRLLYIRPMLWIEQRKYSAAKREWIVETKKNREEHLLKMSKLNSERLMIGLPPIRQKFVPRVQPRPKLFIDRDVMIEMVKDSMANRGEWQNNKSFRPDHQKLLKRAQNRKTFQKSGASSMRRKNSTYNAYGLES